MSEDFMPRRAPLPEPPPYTPPEPTEADVAEDELFAQMQAHLQERASQ